MAYRYTRRRRTASSSRYRTTRRRYTGSRRRVSRRRSTRSTQRIVIQVIGGQGGVPASPVTLGQKANRVVRSRF